MAAAFALACTLFRPWPKNALRGFAENDLTIHDIAIHQQGDARSAQLPAKPQVRDSALVQSADGKIGYIAAAAVAAVLAHVPDAFGGEVG